MNWSGILLAVITFLVIGIFHPIVIKCEYYFSDRCWPVFLVAGLLCLVVSLFIESLLIASVIAGCTGFAKNSTVSDPGTGIFGLFGQYAVVVKTVDREVIEMYKQEYENN